METTIVYWGYMDIMEKQNGNYFNAYVGSDSRGPYATRLTGAFPKSEVPFSGSL